MQEFYFKVDGLTEEDLPRGKKFKLRSTIFVWTTIIVATIYAINYPGQIKINSPKSGFSTNNNVITVTGTVGNIRTKRITLNVNGSSRTLLVQKGAFTSKVPLIRGENTIQASVGGVASNILGRSKVLKVTAQIPRFDIWTELNWNGPGDVDLHLYLPNGEHCYYKQKNTGSGAMLDIDNKERDGPEHIFMENAILGEYRVSVLYYRADSDPPRPISWQVTVRLKDREVQRMYSGVLRASKEEQTVDTFAFP